MKRYNIHLSYQEISVCESEAAELAPRLDDPRRVCSYMQGAFADRPEQESFWVLPLDSKFAPRGRHLMTLGTMTSALVHPREVFRVLVLAGAVSFACVHNHPSGDPSPSSADNEVTHQLREAGKMMGIQLVDHVIIGEARADPLGLGFYSFRSSGIL